MEASAVLEAMLEETRCAICLECMREPVTIDCGHNFCGSCIQQCLNDLWCRFSCPLCRYSCKGWHLNVNSPLARIIDITQLHHSRQKELRQKEECLCERHSEGLSLFYEQDLGVLCPQYTQPPNHQGHHVRSVGEAAFHHRERLSGYIETLKKQVAEVQNLLATQDRYLREMSEVKDLYGIGDSKQ